MRIRYVALLILSVPPVVWLLSVMILATVRKQNTTECRFCRMRKVRPSWPGNILERTSARLGLIPYKCDGCLDRFYGWRDG